VLKGKVVPSRVLSGLDDDTGCWTAPHSGKLRTSAIAQSCLIANRNAYLWMKNDGQLSKAMHD